MATDQLHARRDEFESPEPLVPYPRAMKMFPVIRQSWLSAFDKCALSAKFDQQYRRGWDQHWQARGVMFHRFAGRALREMALHGEMSIEVDVALAILHEVIRQEDIDRECPDCFSTRIKPGISKDGMRTCMDCGARFETELTNLPMHELKDLYWTVIKWANDTSWDTEKLYSVEERLRAVVTYPNRLGGPGVERMLSGQIDALFVDGNEATILDWKDTWGMPGPTEVSFEGYFQQRFYSWLVFKNYRHIEKVTLREFYERYSEAREAVVWRDRVDDIEAELAALAERFDRGFEEKAFPPTPGKHCSWCIRPTGCPIIVPARGEGRILDADHAKKVAGQLVVMESVKDDLTKAMKAWSDIHGPTEVRHSKGQAAYGFQRRVRTVRPTKEQLEAAISAAGGIEHVDLNDLYTESVSTRFGLFRPEESAEQADDRLLAQLQQSVDAARARREESMHRREG